MKQNISRVSLVKGEDRYSNVKQALQLIEDDIAYKIKDKKHILIKPNFVIVDNQLAATHVDAIRAVLDVIIKHTDVSVVIGEGAAMGTTAEGFQQYGYYELSESYNVNFLDLNHDDFIEAHIFDSHLQLIPIKVSKTAAKSDFRISVTPLKTHDTVGVTLSLKNMVAGSLCGSEAKRSLHQGYPAINKSLFELAKLIPPHLSVIDGFVGMEGNGPSSGTPVDMRIALAGTDFLAVDAIATYLMGFDIGHIGYFHYCKEANLGEGNVSKIEVVGNVSIEEVKRKFKPHRNFTAQLDWRINK